MWGPRCSSTVPRGVQHLPHCRAYLRTNTRPHTSPYITDSSTYCTSDRHSHRCSVCITDCKANGGPFFWSHTCAFSESVGVTHCCSDVHTIVCPNSHSDDPSDGCAFCDTDAVAHFNTDGKSHIKSHCVPNGDANGLSNFCTFSKSHIFAYYVADGRPYGDTHSRAHGSAHRISDGCSYSNPIGVSNGYSDGEPFECTNSVTFSIAHSVTHGSSNSIAYRVAHGNTDRGTEC